MVFFCIKSKESVLTSVFKEIRFSLNTEKQKRLSVKVVQQATFCHSFLNITFSVGIITYNIKCTTKIIDANQL